MILSSDPRLVQVLREMRSPEVSPDVAQGAHWLASLIAAARSWQTIGQFTDVAKTSNNRFAAPVDGAWAITFSWDYDVNHAFEMRLEKFR